MYSDDVLVIDISEDEDTLLYYPKHEDLFEVFDKKTAGTTLSPQPKPTKSQQALAPQPTLPVKTPPLSCTDDEDVIEVIEHIDVINIDDDEEEVIQNERNTNNVISSQPQPEEQQLAYSNFGTPIEPSLNTSPLTYSEDIKDADTFKLKSKEIALNLVSQQVLSNTPSAMAVIPSLESKNDKKIASWSFVDDEDTLLLSPPQTSYNYEMDSLTEELTKNQGFEQLSPVEASGEENHNLLTSKLSVSCSTADDPLEGPSTLLGDARSCLDSLEDAAQPPRLSPKTLPMLESPEHPTEEMPQKLFQSSKTRPSCVVTLPITSSALEQIAQPRQSNSKHLNKQASYLNEKNTRCTISITPSKEVPRSSQQLLSPTVPGEEMSSTFPSMPISSTTKTSIFDCSESYQFFYRKLSPEKQKHFEQISLHRKKIMNILEKYSNADAKPKIDEGSSNLNVIEEAGTDHCQNSNTNEKAANSNEVGFNDSSIKQKIIVEQKLSKTINIESMAEIKENLERCGTTIDETNKFDHLKSQINEFVEPNKNGSIPSTLSSFHKINLKKCHNTSIENNISTEMNCQSNMIITPKKPDLIKNIIAKEKKEKKKVMFKHKPEIWEINETTYYRKNHKEKNKLNKRSYPVETVNQNMIMPNDNINTDDDSPKYKKNKIMRNNTEQSKTIASNTYRVDNVIDKKIYKKHKSSKHKNHEYQAKKQSLKRTKEDDPIKIKLQKPKKTKPVTINSTNSAQLKTNEDHEHIDLNLSPNSSKQLHKELTKETVKMTDDNKGKCYKVVPQPNNSEAQFKIVLKIEYNNSNTNLQGAHQPAHNTLDYIPESSKNTGVGKSNNISHLNEYSKPTSDPNLQHQIIDRYKQNNFKTAYLPSAPIYPSHNNTRTNTFLPIPISRSETAINPLVNMMRLKPQDNFRAFSSVTPSNIGNVSGPVRYQNNYMTVNGLHPIAQSNADILKKDAIRRVNANSSFLKYPISPWYHTFPYRPFQPF